ncbi:MarR family transcriptional regulator [Mycobacterium sp. B14F4]|uniref:MarR family winged helix-turn-helix transcriptional regulator n=1 Tax=Mycobacterium sp. B14F4 TaxID=3153565 RepID=UPI00325C9201
MPSTTNRDAQTDSVGQSTEFLTQLELATRGLLALNVSALERLEKRIGLAPLRALQALDRLGPSLVTELGDDLGLLPSTASRLSDRLADAGYITRRVSPTNRRATLLELTDAGRAVLDELIALRVEAFGAVTRRMTQADLAALIQGTRAFTAAHRELAGDR